MGRVHRGPSTLRVSKVGAGGALAGTSDLATGARVDGLRATSTAKGIDFWWYEGESVVRVASIACAAAGR